MIWLGLMIHHTKAFIVVFEPLWKIQKQFPSVEKNRFEIFDFSSYLERIQRANSLVLIA